MTKFRILIGLAFLLLVGADDTIREPGWCSSYDSCGYNSQLENAAVRGEIPCKNNTKAMVLEPRTAHYVSFANVCPDMVAQMKDDVRACCSPKQLNTLDTQIVASVLLFNRCPSCIENFRNFYCQITCSPNQASFLNITATVKNDGRDAVTDESIYIAEEFSNGVHSSCKDVVFPQTNGKAMSLVCNGFSGDDCTTQNFLNYLGSTNNGVAPLNMDFHQIGNTSEEKTPPEGMGVLNTYAYSCNEAVSVNGSICSCTDCEASCPAPPELDQPPAPFTIGTADGVGVIMLIIFLAFAAVFITYLFISCACANKKANAIDFSMVEIERKIKESGGFDEKNQGPDYENFGRPLVTKDQITVFERLGKNVQDAIRKGFTCWGTLVARRPLFVLVPTLLITIALCVGMKFIILTTDPIELWSSKGSRVRMEKDYFDQHFGAFFRTEQIIMTLKPQYVKGGSVYESYTGATHNFSDIFEYRYLEEMLKIQNKIRYMQVEYEDDNGAMQNATLNDICFKPLEPDNNNCTITSITGYWQNDLSLLNITANYYNKITQTNTTVDYREHFLYCAQAPATIQDTTPLKQSCMGDFEGPVFPFLVVGGQAKDGEYNEGVASLITFVINNYEKGDIRTKIIKAWEQRFLKEMSEWETEYFDFVYFSERSPEDELERSSQADLVVFVISYLVIFLYIAVALGTYTSFRRIPVDSKVTLGVAGILVIIASVLASIGFFGYIGYETSLIVIEVVPFLVLAIGADNVFILTLEYQRSERHEDESISDHIGRVFGEVAPSMLLSSLTECVVFFLGALTDMPAVEQFALAAAVAIVFDFVLQITIFLAVLALDARRQEQNRVDCFCCFKVAPDEKKEASYLQTFFHKYYAPFLMNDLVRLFVMLAFAGLSCWCVVLTSKMTVGLDQDLSVPKDSYVLDYFDYMEKYLDVGVPVYFVTKGPYDFSNPAAGSQICSFAGCDTYSLTQQISYASQNPEYWKIETPAQSWYDDYVDWLPPQGRGGRKSCCRSYARNQDEFCPASDTTSRCNPCLSNASYTSEEFMQFLPWFLIDNPGLECNKGGHSAYGNAVNITNNYTSTSQDVVEASYFMAYHSVCIKSVDCTENLIKARKLAENITKTIKAANTDSNGNIIGNEDDFTVYPYCLYYVYYEQYLTMVDDTLFQIGICLIPTFFFNLVLLGFDWYSGLVTLITILMIVVDTAGLSSLWGVDLNAVSLINLVAAIGLSVEFTSHVVRTFSLKTNLTRKERVIDAMASMGPAVFAGVALTNLPGIIVLNWATAQLIQIFFFRMCLIITLLGTAHGLIFLPVFLSYFGPPVNKAIVFENQTMLRKAAEQHGIANQGYKGGTLQYKKEQMNKQDTDTLESRKDYATSL